MASRRAHALAAAARRFAGVGAALSVSFCAPGGHPERQGEARAHVAQAVAARSADEVHARLARGLAGALGAADKFRDAHLAASDDPVFPDPQQLRLAAGDDPALAAYAALDHGQRQRDFYVFDLSDTYWTSEYVWRGRPARFKTDFIVHVADADAGGARVEVAEYRPRVNLGEYFDLRGHHGPGFYDDVRFVAPTTRDREELLELVVGLLAER
jgi:hypothetical protein